MSTAVLLDTNRLVSDRADITRAFSDPETLLVLHYLSLRGKSTADEVVEKLGLSARRGRQILAALKSSGLVDATRADYVLTPESARRLSPPVSYDFLLRQHLRASPDVAHRLESAYFIKERIGHGATSVTFLSEQEKTGADRTLKVFLPNTVTYEQLAQAIKLRTSAIQECEAIPDVIDLGNVDLNSTGGRLVVPAVSFSYIANAVTFAEFLQKPSLLNQAIFERFVERIGGALQSIEMAGLKHGDLHEGNILVALASSTQVREFWVIDFIGVPSGMSPHLEQLSDIEYFRDHLLRAVLVASGRSPGVPARVILGDKVFRVLQGLRQHSYSTFQELMTDFSRRGVSIPTDHFRPPLPDPFHGLRVENLDDPQMLYELFVPVPSRFDLIANFGNTWISGPRGCGKSHYVRVLEFNPEVIAASENDLALNKKLQELRYDFRRAFGILFACRVGEFKPFIPEAVNGKDVFDPATILFLKHVLVLKIWNKTFDAIGKGLSGAAPLLQITSNISELVSFLEKQIGPVALVCDSNPTEIFRQCALACAGLEKSSIAVWNLPAMRLRGSFLDERSVDQFFKVLKSVIPELSQTKFFILVDDASQGSIHWEMQRVLNSLVRSSQAAHCFKITFDKYMYTLDTTDGRSIDPRHEVNYVDLGEISGKSEKQSKADKVVSVDLSTYMAEVLDLRLRKAGFTHPIKRILGKSQSAREFLPLLAKPVSAKSVPKSKRIAKAYYGGWNIILSLSHGSVRTLLQLTEQIFGSVNAESDVKSITLANQDAAVRKFSKRQYAAMSMLPDELNGAALGPRFQAVISAIGRVSKEYLLRYDTGDSSRWYETISIERLDTKQLEPDADKILFELVKYGLVMNEGVTFSRAQFGLTARYDLNKIFAPAFQITYRVRNHLYLGQGALEQLLLQPDRFIRRHRNKLAELTVNKHKQQKLFSE